MMRSIAAAAVVVVFGATPAAADSRFAIGASLGSTEGDEGRDEISTRGVFARLALGTRFWLQAEIGSGELENLDDSTWKSRRGAIGLRADLGSGQSQDGDRPSTAKRQDGDRPSTAKRQDGDRPSTAKRWMPYLVGFIGGERWFGGGWDYGVEADFTSRELGGGVDLALGSEVAIGVDLRFGRRELERTRFTDDVVIAIVPPPPPIDVEDGDYASIRLTLTAKL